MQTIHSVIKDTSPSQEHQYHHQLQPEIYKCNRSLRGFLMPLNSSDFNQILNIASSGHVETIQNIIKDTSPSQEHQNHHQFQQELERGSWCLQIHRFQPNFKHSCLRAYADHPKGHQGNQPLQIFLMPSNSTDFNQIWNIAPSGHVEYI